MKIPHIPTILRQKKQGRNKGKQVKNKSRTSASLALSTTNQKGKRKAKECWWSRLAPGRGGVPTAHRCWAPAICGCTASLGVCTCCMINSQPIINPQPLSEPSKLNHSFRPDPAPNPKNTIATGQSRAARRREGRACRHPELTVPLQAPRSL